MTEPRKKPARNSTLVSRALRNNQTDAETAFWHAVKAKRLNGLKFRRQFPVGPYYADFACVESLLIVEIDGGQHNENPRDAIRDKYLQQQGYAVLRFWNNDVLGNLDGVLTTVAEKAQSPLSLRERVREREGAAVRPASHTQHCTSPLPDPLPEGEGEERLPP